MKKLFLLLLLPLLWACEDEDKYKVPGYYEELNDFLIGEWVQDTRANNKMCFIFNRNFQLDCFVFDGSTNQTIYNNEVRTRYQLDREGIYLKENVLPTYLYRIIDNNTIGICIRSNYDGVFEPEEIFFREEYY